MLRFKLTETAANASVFSERRQTVGAAAVRVKQRGNGMPAVVAQEAGCAVVTGYDRDRGI